MASQTHEHGRFRPRQRTSRPGGQRRHYATTLAARHGLALRDRGEAGTREVPAPRGPRSEASRWQTPPACTAILQPETGSRYRTGKRRGPARVLPPGAQVRSQPVADATRMYGYPAARHGLALQDRGKVGTREVPAPGGPGPKPAGGRRHPHVRPQHSSASGQASFGTTPPPCSPKRARATDRGEAGIAEAPAPRGGGAGGLQGPTPAANPPCGRWSLRQRSARADRTHVRRTARPPPPQQPGPSGSWVAEPAEVPPARQGRSQLVSVSGSPSSRASHRHRPTARTARGRSGENGTKAASRPRAMGMSEAGTGPGVACSCLHTYKHS